MAAGAECTPALRSGLRHPNPVVRARCCVVLDHFLDASALPELIANLDHENEHVRRWALHALECDRCKEGECRPGEDDVVPIALRMLAEDPSRRVRGEGCGASRTEQRAAPAGGRRRARARARWRSSSERAQDRRAYRAGRRDLPAGHSRGVRGREGRRAAAVSAKAAPATPRPPAITRVQVRQVATRSRSSRRRSTAFSCGCGSANGTAGTSVSVTLVSALPPVVVPLPARATAGPGRTSRRGP